MTLSAGLISLVIQILIACIHLMILIASRFSRVDLVLSIARLLTIKGTIKLFCQVTLN